MSMPYIAGFPKGQKARHSAEDLWQVRMDETVDASRILEYVNKRTNRNVEVKLPLSTVVMRNLVGATVLIGALMLIMQIHKLLLNTKVWLLIAYTGFVMCVGGTVYNTLNGIPWFKLERDEYGGVRVAEYFQRKFKKDVSHELAEAFPERVMELRQVEANPERTIDFQAGARPRLVEVATIAVGEYEVHGLDLAAAIGRPWQIDGNAAAMAIMGAMPAAGAQWLDPATAADHSGRYRIKLRGKLGQLHITFDDSSFPTERSKVTRMLSGLMSKWT